MFVPPSPATGETPISVSAHLRRGSLNHEQGAASPAAGCAAGAGEAPPTRMVDRRREEAAATTARVDVSEDEKGAGVATAESAEGDASAGRGDGFRVPVALVANEIGSGRASLGLGAAKQVKEGERKGGCCVCTDRSARYRVNRDDYHTLYLYHTYVLVGFPLVERLSPGQRGPAPPSRALRARRRAYVCLMVAQIPVFDVFHVVTSSHQHRNSFCFCIIIVDYCAVFNILTTVSHIRSQRPYFFSTCHVPTQRFRINTLSATRCFPTSRLTDVCVLGKTNQRIDRMGANERRSWVETTGAARLPSCGSSRSSWPQRGSWGPRKRQSWSRSWCETREPKVYYYMYLYCTNLCCCLYT